MARKKVQAEAKTMAEAKQAAPVETVKAEPMKATSAAKTEEKAAPAKSARKTAPKKAAELKTSICVQYLGKEIHEKEIIAQAKKAWTAKKNKVADIKTIELYVKPEDNAVYYVINGDFSGNFEI